MKLLSLFVVVMLIFAAFDCYAALPCRAGAITGSISSHAGEGVAVESGHSLIRRVLTFPERFLTGRGHRGNHLNGHRKDVHDNSMMGIVSMLCAGLGTLFSCIALNTLFWGGMTVLLGPFFLGGACFAAGIILARQGILHDKHSAFARIGLVLNIIGGAAWFCLLLPTIGIGGF